MTAKLRALSQQYRQYPVNAEVERFRTRHARHVNRMRLNRMRRYTTEITVSRYEPPFVDGDIFPLPTPPRSSAELLRPRTTTLPLPGNATTNNTTEGTN